MSRVIWILVIILSVFDVAFIGHLLCSGRPPAWVMGKPLNWFLELALLLGVFGAPILIVNVLKTILTHFFGQKGKMLENWNVPFLAGLVLFTLYLISIWPAPRERTEGSAGERLYDRYIGVLIPQRFKGMLLAEENYDLQMELENQSSMTMYISKIIATYSNAEVAKLLGRPNKIVYVTTDHVTRYVKSHEKQVISVEAGPYLPRNVEVSIYHSLSDKPSWFFVDVGGIVVDLPEPRHLPPEKIYHGIDGLVAIEKAKNKARIWSKDVNLVVAFPGNKNLILEPHSRLKVTQVKSWGVSFCSCTKGGYFVMVGEDQIEGSEYDYEGNCNPFPFPQIGNQQALELADRNNLLCANWKTLSLVGGKVGEKWTCAWYLPYLGPDSFPLLIDATTGHRLRLIGAEGDVRKGGFRIFKRLELLSPKNSSSIGSKDKKKGFAE